MNKQKFMEDSFDLEETRTLFKKKARKSQEIKKAKKAISVYTVLSAVLALAIVLIIYKIAVYYIELENSRRIAQMAREFVAATPAPTPVPTPVPRPTITPEPVYEHEPEPEDEIIIDLEPEIPEERVILDKIKNLREAFSNDDIVGYLKIEGTNIDYAVVQSTDNEFYLHRDLNLKNNAAGSIFMDYENNPHEIDRNIVIYGHNMRNGTKFHNLRHYRDRQFYENNRYISFTTLYEETTWEIFAIYETTIDFHYIQVIFKSDDEFISLISQMKAKSLINTGIEVGPNDRVLTLSTCRGTHDDDRFVVSAKLITLD